MDWDVRRFREIDSTNAWVHEQARAGAPEGLVAVADHQTQGRGRLGRTWLSPPGTGLLLSVLLRPALGPARLHLTAAAVALAAAAACEDVAGVRPELKWPNDLVAAGAKLAGVLAEVSGEAAVVGLGLNVTWSPPGAVALADLAGRPVERDELLARLLAHLGGLVGRWDEVASHYRRSCATIGRAVRVELVDESFTGDAVDVGDDGALLVDVGACLRAVVAGDVVHLRTS